MFRAIGVWLMVRYVRSLGHYDLLQRQHLFQAIHEGHTKTYPNDNMYDRHYSLVLWLTQATPDLKHAHTESMGLNATDATVKAIDAAKWHAEFGCSPPLYPV